MELWFVFVAGGLFILGIMVYVLLMVFLPEWVGITGKKALEAEQSHAGDAGAPTGADTGPASDVLHRMEKVPNERTASKKD
jgi:hypothetical protein